jgi:hypothetical protein
MEAIMSDEAPRPGSARWLAEKHAEYRRWRELNPEEAAKQEGAIKEQLARLLQDRGTYTSSLLDEMMEQDRTARREAREGS